MRWLVLACGLLSACGGKVFVDPVGAGGAGGESGSSSASSSSSSASSSSGSSTCPDPFPGIGVPCDTEGATCLIDGACCGEHAVCQGGLWNATGPLCGMPCVPCGPAPFACALDRVCVVDVSWVSAYHCAPNPCGGDVTCSCAQSLCDPGFVCVGAANAQVPCECQGC